jgi:hypothetical protein
MRFQEAPDQGLVLLFLRRHSGFLLLANLHPSYGSALSMMPHEELLGIDWRLIHPTSGKVPSQKFALGCGWWHHLIGGQA